MHFTHHVSRFTFYASHIMLIAMLLCTTVISDADINDKAGTYGATFLKMDAGSRPVGMGGAFVGLANDVNTLFWNPAGLTSVEHRELTAMQNFSFADVNSESVGYAQRLGDDSAWGASFLGTFAEIERRAGPTKDPDTTFTAGGFAVGVAYGKQLMSNLAVGGQAKLVTQQLDIEDTTGAGVDAGVLLSLLNQQLSVGASIQNLGILNFNQEEGDDSSNILPMMVRAGAAYYLKEGNLILVGDVNVPIDAAPTMHAGVEAWFFDRVFAVRAGYSEELTAFGKSVNPERGLSVGLGLKAWGTKPLENVNFQFDYAFTPNRDVGDVHRIAFISRF